MHMKLCVVTKKHIPTNAYETFFLYTTNYKYSKQQGWGKEICTQTLINYSYSGLQLIYDSLGMEQEACK